MFRIFRKRKKEREIKTKELFNVFGESKGSFDDFLDALKKQSLIVIITGRRGSGKTALGFSFLDFLKNNKRRKYIFGLSARLPGWIKQVNSLNEIRNNSILVLDESALSFSSRESTNKINKLITKIMAIARHKNLTLIFISQSSAMIDINILRLADVIIIKQPGLLQERFERKEIKKLYEKVKPLFNKLEDKKKYAYIYSDWFEGLIKAELPSFWNERISKGFSNVKMKI